ncbi:hypothetical protein [Moorena producens]|uniref:hypothetical protein n=1 Tax=Moorena producens TaxID=1155739 RepID=UPI0013144424|nr:hypothetical protein [Moorena producens]
MPIAYCLLPIAYCLLPIAYCLLPIAYCLLPIAFCLKKWCVTGLLGTKLNMMAIPPLTHPTHPTHPTPYSLFPIPYSLFPLLSQPTLFPMGGWFK